MPVYKIIESTDLTLEKTIKICKSAELSEKQVKQFEATRKIASISKQGSSTYKKRGSKNTKIQRAHIAASASQPNSAKHEAVCQRCGYSHRYKNCPAFDKECRQCGKKGHFAVKCKNAEKLSVKAVEVSDEQEDDDLDEFFCN